MTSFPLWNWLFFCTLTSFSLHSFWCSWCWPTPHVCWPFILFLGGFCPPLPQCGIVIGLQIALYILRMYKIHQNSVSEFSLIDLFRMILSLRNTLNDLKCFKTWKLWNFGVHFSFVVMWWRPSHSWICECLLILVLQQS